MGKACGKEREGMTTPPQPRRPRPTHNNRSTRSPRRSSRNSARVSLAKGASTPRQTQMLAKLRRFYNFVKALDNFRAALVLRDGELRSQRSWLDEADQHPANEQTKNEQPKREKPHHEKRNSRKKQPKIYPVYRASQQQSQTTNSYFGDSRHSVWRQSLFKKRIHL